MFDVGRSAFAYSDVRLLTSDLRRPAFAQATAWQAAFSSSELDVELPAQPARRGGRTFSELTVSPPSPSINL